MTHVLYPAHMPNAHSQLTRADLLDLVCVALRQHGGSAHLIQVAKHIWDHHEAELRESGSLFFTWQYDMRWAAMKLRKRGVLQPTDDEFKGVWRLA